MVATSYKTLIIGVWLGDWPVYLPIFMKGVEYNADLNWLIISDNQSCPYSFENLKHISMSRQEIESLAAEKLGFSVPLGNPRKLCDLKPAYGALFEEHLPGYDYWGYTDLDLLTGRLSRYLHPVLAERPDILSFYQNFISGPFCLFRNTVEINNLFRKIPDHEKILKDPKHHAMDENNSSTSHELRRFASLMKKTSYLVSKIGDGRFFRWSMSEFRYNYQWYLKEKAAMHHIPDDMTDLAWRIKQEGNLSVQFREWIHSDRAFKRKGKNKWEVLWEKGGLNNGLTGKEFPVFHFVEMKERMGKEAPGKDRTFIRIKINVQGVRTY